jgi:hypothetical protein
MLPGWARSNALRFRLLIGSAWRPWSATARHPRSKTPQKVVWRAQIVLLTGEGLRATEVAARVGPSTLTVRRWRRRYAQAGVEGLLKDAPRPPGRKPLMAAVIQLG